MDLNKMVQHQRDFDAKHGWIPAEHDTEAVFRTLQEDLIGLFGEVGEIANIIKKIALEKARSDSPSTASLLADKLPSVSEEVVDSLIYLMRIAGHLQINLEEEYLKKLALNEERFRRYEDTTQ